MSKRGCASPVRLSPNRNSCSPTDVGTDGTLSSLAEVVDDYIARWRKPERGELNWFARQPSLDAAVEKAATAAGEHGKLSHQWRLENSVLRQFARRLLTRIGEIQRTRTFAELHDNVLDAAIKGVAALTLYDTATRIGAFLNLEPDLVYLHAGTAKGAAALGFRRRETLRKSELPEEFWRLTPGEIEDCLCIYKRDIARVVDGVFV